MLKKVQVHALPIKPYYAPNREYYIDALIKVESIHYKPYWEKRRFMDGQRIENSYYLYFTTDEEIKNSDWFLEWDNIDKRYSLHQCKPNGWQAQKATRLKTCRKIVATTNPDLWSTGYNIKGDVTSIPVPKIGLDFVEAFVREQGAIKEVNLEYELYPYAPIAGSIDQEFLKLHSNGTVIIHPIKEKMYTKFQVEQYCRKLHFLCPKWFNEQFDDWFKEIIA